MEAPNCRQRTALQVGSINDPRQLRTKAAPLGFGTEEGRSPDRNSEHATAVAWRKARNCELISTSVSMSGQAARHGPGSRIGLWQCGPGGLGNLKARSCGVLQRGESAVGPTASAALEVRPAAAGCRHVGVRRVPRRPIAARRRHGRGEADGREQAANSGLHGRVSPASLLHRPNSLSI